MARGAVCIGCGQPTGPGPRLNRLLDGRPCPSCSDRLLESLPPVLPSSAEQYSFEDRSDDAEDASDDYLDGA